MAYVRRATWLVTVLVLMSVSKSMHAQQAGQLQPTATAAAGASFRSAIYESQNLGPARAASHIAAAIAADPQFGLARIYQTVLMPGLTAQQRESQIRQHLAGMGGANPAEILMGVYWRESAAGRAAGAVPILKAVAEMVPGDAEVGYIFNGTERAGKTSAEQVAILRSFLARFPGHAAAHNQMAYTLWAVGDHDGALASAQQYARYAPEHPNAHDTYADILLLLGRGREAIPHVQREIELDPSFAGAYTKLGAIHLTMGEVPQARIVLRAGARAAVDRVGCECAGRAGAGPRPRRGARRIHGQRKVGGYPSRGRGRGGGERQPACAAPCAYCHCAFGVGQAAEARRAATEYARLAPGNALIASIDVILALDSKDYRAAEAAAARLAANDMLARSLRAELMVRTGRRSEGDALRKELLATSVKVDGQPPVNFFSVIGRMRLTAL